LRRGQASHRSNTGCNRKTLRYCYEIISIQITLKHVLSKKKNKQKDTLFLLNTRFKIFRICAGSMVFSATVRPQTKVPAQKRQKSKRSIDWQVDRSKTPSPNIASPERCFTWLFFVLT
jgi:hypothetical protein